MACAICLPPHASKLDVGLATNEVLVLVSLEGMYVHKVVHTIVTNHTLLVLLQTCDRHMKYAMRKLNY